MTGLVLALDMQPALFHDGDAAIGEDTAASLRRPTPTLDDAVNEAIPRI